MQIIKKVHDTLNERLVNLEAVKAESSSILQSYAADGDLSENNDFIQEKQRLEDYTSEIEEIKSLLKNADINNKPLTIRYSQIQLGCIFHMYITRQGNFFQFAESTVKSTIDKTKFDDVEELLKESHIIYNADNSTTSIEGNYCFGGPSDICSEDNILSSASPIGKLLLGREIQHDPTTIHSTELNCDITYSLVNPDLIQNQNISRGNFYENS